MPYAAKPFCKKGHPKPLDADCSTCARDRALARYYANKDSTNPVRNEKRRGTYKPRAKPTVDGIVLCRKGLHKATGGPCQPCRLQTRRDQAGALCKNGHVRDSPGGVCSTCRREYRIEWYANHQESENAKSLARYYKLKSIGINPNDPRRNRRWKLANRESVNEHSRQYYARNADKHRVLVDSWRERNPERAAEISRAAANRRHARKLGAEGSHTQSEWDAIVARQRGFCVGCGQKRKLTKDHIVPLSKGGSDYAWNIQGMCKPCNSRKRASLPSGTQLGLYDRVTEIHRA